MNTQIELREVKRPGFQLADSAVFQLKINKKTRQEAGVIDPMGKFWPFLEGENLSLVRDDLARDRVVCIVKSDGNRVSFEEWESGFIVEQPPSVWRYDTDKNIILGPNEQPHDIDTLTEDELFDIAIAIRNGSAPVPWPSDLAEKLTNKLLEMRAEKKKGQQLDEKQDNSLLQSLWQEPHNQMARGVFREIRGDVFDGTEDYALIFLGNYIETTIQMNMRLYENEIDKMYLTDDGRFAVRRHVSHLDEREQDIEIWKAIDGVIDAASYEDTLIVIYNAAEKIPEGCPDLMNQNHAGRPRSGVYDYTTRTCYVDLSNSYSYLTGRFEPKFVQEFVRHEIRHAIVDMFDDEYSRAFELKEKRNADREYLEKTNPDHLRQLAYLDEMHSQYFDALEGSIEGKNYFRNINSRFYTTVAEGSHLEVASLNHTERENAGELFHYIQGMLLLNQMLTQGKRFAFKKGCEVFTKEAGVMLGTERSVAKARDKTKLIWEKVISSPEISREFKGYLRKYKPSIADNTPEITPELLKTLEIVL